ncbi:MAG: hypothetical protein WA344_21415, partial [Ralstonia pickettii]
VARCVVGGVGRQLSMKKMGRQMGGGVFCLWFLGWWSAPLSFPAGTDLLFFVLPKKSKQKKGAPEMATSP